MMRLGVVVALTALVAWGAPVNASGSDAAKARAVAEAAEKAIHTVSVFSYVQDWRRPGAASPLLITLNIRGLPALTAFCHNIPAVQEAVLMAMIRATRLASNDPGKLVTANEPLRSAIGRIVTTDAIRALDITRGEKAREFGPPIKATTATCKEYAPEPKAKKKQEKKE